MQRSSVGRAAGKEVIQLTSKVMGMLSNREALAVESVFTVENVSYLPMPNTVEVVLCDRISPKELTRTAMVVPCLSFANRTVMMTENRRRGPEWPGGHIEDGETVFDAAIRELSEEIGCNVEMVWPIGFLRMISYGTVPNGWKYPHPVGYQQFFMTRIEPKSILPLIETDEIAGRIFVNCDKTDLLIGSKRVFAEHALSQLHRLT